MSTLLDCDSSLWEGWTRSNKTHFWFTSSPVDVNVDANITDVDHIDIEADNGVNDIDTEEENDTGIFSIANDVLDVDNPVIHDSGSGTSEGVVVLAGI